MKNSLIILSIVFAVACKPAATPSKSVRGTTHTEDLSANRPVLQELDFASLTGADFGNDQPTEKPVYPDPSTKQTIEFVAMMDTIAKNYKKANFIQGYTIQVYLGSSSEKADEIKQLVEELLQGELANVQYRQPNYRVQVGSYIEKLEIQKVLAIVQSEFPNAIAVPHRINITDF